MDLNQKIEKRLEEAGYKFLGTQPKDKTLAKVFLEKVNRERELQWHLSQIFTKKQKQIIKSVLNEKPVSKTDYEYYSRTIKKKVYALIYLQEFTKMLLFRKPKLIKLKKQ